ncbi:MAG: hypothetical protein KAY24_17625 [Candidatus Eisenbacteria sp.]|nr:hypothetical protein [Candidatus Eisenbacteria bacterium]
MLFLKLLTIITIYGVGIWNIVVAFDKDNPIKWVSICIGISVLTAGLWMPVKCVLELVA